MSTLQEVCDRIRLDYLNRSSGLEAETVRAVQAAIRNYERQRFPWNETLTTATCTSNQSYFSIPSDFLVLDNLELQYQSQNNNLQTATFKTILLMNSVSTTPGVPTHFALRGNLFHIAAIPDSAYLVNCYYLQKLPRLESSAMTASNKWLSAAEDLVVYHASKILWANTLRNSEEAAKMFALEKTAFMELTTYRAQREHISIVPTRF